MCGIVGILDQLGIREHSIQALELASQRLEKRGPDAAGLKAFESAAFAHRRLSIIDTSESANQPFIDESERYSLVFNGEIFNYLEIKKELIGAGYHFRTNSDTEVVLIAYLHYGSNFLNKLNGFFALAIYDSLEKNCFLARDRFGIKPLIYYKSETQFIFASEMKAILAFDIPREIDQSSLFAYLQLNYVPEPHSMLQHVKKLAPGHYLKIDSKHRVQKIPFYQINYPPEQGIYSQLSYGEAQEKFLDLLDQSVERRMVSDVPLGTFLSGGIDSSLITALAAQKTDKLSTFSIGFPDEPHFDETHYAQLVAKKYNTQHHVFEVRQKDLLESLYQSLDYFDEPFADSSALAVNLLSQKTSLEVKVALSGDGADELFAGYHKHHGEYLLRQQGIKQNLVKGLKPLWELLPKSRNSKIGNQIRKLHKFAEGSSLNQADRYWLWASLMNEAEVSNLLLKKAKSSNYLSRKENLLKTISNGNDFNDVLATDVSLVLLSDMLRKVDLMSMSNGLEVRTPFLDHHLVNFAFSLPSNYKIDGNMKKKLVQDAARELLPPELYNRPKQGFEVPLLPWFKGELKEQIEKEWLHEKFIAEQNLFRSESVNELWKKANSSNPQDSAGNIWALICFNAWWKRYIA